MNAQQPVRIVMIEDDEGHARLIEKNIRRAGISNALTHFLDGTTALEYLFESPEGPAKNGPALVLLDLNLPGMDGFEVAEAIGGFNRSKDTPIIFLSAVNIEKKFVTKGYCFLLSF